MRACEGCRRRKIKCDAATTNAWPCAACIRLKLNCVPPTVSYDKDFGSGTQTFELETKPIEYASPTLGGQHEYQRHPVIAHGVSQQMPAQVPTPVSATYADGIRMYQTAPYMDPPPQDHVHYSSIPQPQVVGQSVSYPPHQIYSDAPPAAPVATMSPPDTEPNWRNDPTSSLAEALGELKIDYTAIGKAPITSIIHGTR